MRRFNSRIKNIFWSITIAPTHDSSCHRSSPRLRFHEPQNNSFCDAERKKATTYRLQSRAHSPVRSTTRFCVAPFITLSYHWSFIRSPVCFTPTKSIPYEDIRFPESNSQYIPFVWFVINCTKLEKRCDPVRSQKCADISVLSVLHLLQSLIESLIKSCFMYISNEFVLARCYKIKYENISIALMSRLSSDYQRLSQLYKHR